MINPVVASAVYVSPLNTKDAPSEIVNTGSKYDFDLSNAYSYSELVVVTVRALPSSFVYVTRKLPVLPCSRVTVVVYVVPLPAPLCGIVVIVIPLVPSGTGIVTFTGAVGLVGLGVTVVVIVCGFVVGFVGNAGL